ncbi:unnamed protein product, partial [marine sediment metagenome]
EMAIELGLNEVAEKMKEAVEFMNKANEMLLEAFKMV